MRFPDGCARESSCYIAATVVAALAAVALGIANLWLGPLNQDEGWYLMAARLIRDGAMPYRDFAFTQGPVMPLLYAPLTPLIARGGLAAARALTMSLGLLTVWTAAVLSGRMVSPDGRRAAVCMTWILAGINVYQSYFTTVVKTYAAAGLILTAGLYLCFPRRGKYSRTRWAAAAAVLVLAAGARLSLAVVPLVIWVFLWRARRGGTAAAWLWFGLGGGASALLVFLPFAAAAPEGFWFGMVEYHAGRTTGSTAAALALKAGFVSRMTQAYFPAVAGGLALLMHALFYGRAGSGPPADTGTAMMRKAVIWALALVTLIHAMSPFPYDDYQAAIYAPVCALLAAALARRIGGAVRDPRRGMGFATALLGLTALAASGASPINQDWFVSGRDRIWWRLKPRPDIVVLRETAAGLRAFGAAEGDELLTQDAYLAIEANMRIPVPMTMGPFSYFPAMPAERARRLHVMNREILTEILRESRASLAAFSGYGLAIAAPEIVELPAAEREFFGSLLRERYETVKTVPAFGQAHTTLRIMKLRETP